MKRYTLLFLVVFPVIIGISVTSIPASADQYVVEDGDYIDYGFQMFINGSLIESRDESNPFKVAITWETSKPPGLYDHLIGMNNGEIKTEIVIPPEDGFFPSDPTYGMYADQAVTFYNLQIYKINGWHYTDLTPQPTPKPFGFWLLTVGGSILGVAGAILLIYGGYRFYPKLFGKRCIACKKSATGHCKNCGKAFCNNCYSEGCPYCKGRSLIRF